MKAPVKLLLDTGNDLPVVFVALIYIKLVLKHLPGLSVVL